MDFTYFEKVYDTYPHALCDSHPDGTLISMQVFAQTPRTIGLSTQTVKNAVMHTMQRMKQSAIPESLAKFIEADNSITDTRLRCAIWDRYSGKRVLAPVDTVALAWLHDGHEMGLLRERYRNRPEMHTVLGSPLQSEFTYTWGRGSWPERKHLSTCQITMPTGAPRSLAISPCSDLAVFQWIDQAESGLEFIAISAQGDQQIMHTGLPILENVTDLCFRFGGNGFPLGSNFASPPLFSPDGRFIVCVWQENPQWWIDEAEEQRSRQADDFAPTTGSCQAGFVEIIDWEHRSVREIAITATIPKGWEPPDYRDKRATSLIDSSPAFIDHEHFTLLLPTGEMKTYSVHEDGPTTRVIKQTSQVIALREQARLETMRQ